MEVWIVITHTKIELNELCVYVVNNTALRLQIEEQGTTSKERLYIPSCLFRNVRKEMLYFFGFPASIFDNRLHIASNIRILLFIFIL